MVIAFPVEGIQQGFRVSGEMDLCKAAVLLALDGDLAVAEPKKLRFRLLSAPARYVRHARQRILKIPTGWAWATDLADAYPWGE